MSGCMTLQLDVFRHSDAALAAAYREAARTARLNPYEPEERAEIRARHYEAKAEELEARA